MFSVNVLSSGGIIPTYRCPAECRHCLYNCSKEMDEHYITPAQSEFLCETLYRLKCPSAHIGGGEPFLNVDGLVALLRSMKRYGIVLDYIETNAAWVTDDEDRVLRILERLLQEGVECIMVSVDPFHVEYIPLVKPLRLIRLCKQVGMQYFIWKEAFLRSLSKLDVNRTYTREEIEAKLGKEYIVKTAKNYGLGFNGRSLALAHEFMQRRPHTDFTNGQYGPCRELHAVTHFHADYNARFIPPGCTGLGVELSDLKNGVTMERYPVFCTLAENGIGGLFEYALRYGFKPHEKGYVSKCDLCFDIRYFLAHDARVEYSRDIYPIDFYIHGVGRD